jgi:hypothetical protein
MSSKRMIAWLVVAAASAVLLSQLEPSPAPPAAPPPQRVASPAVSQPTEALGSVPVREPIAPPRGELFGPRSWDPPSATQAARRSVQKRAAPPMPYRVAGQVMRKEGVRVVLAKENDVYVVGEGETLEDGYRVESIRPDAVILVYLPLARRERLEVSGAMLEVDPRRAQLREEPHDMRAASGGTVAR